MQAILVAHNHDESDILAFVLKHAGLAVAVSMDMQRVVDKWLERPSDLLVIANTSTQSLIPNLEALRNITQVPCLVIIDPPTEEMLCQLLNAGADLVLSRPVAPRVLHEYVRALLRRTHTVPTFVLPRLNVDAVKLDPDTRTVIVLDKEPRRLTQLEFRLLYVLMVNRGHVVFIDMIVDRVWGYTGQGSRELVRGLVSRLRRKIEPDPAAPQFIKNVPGVGYRFTLTDI